FGIENRSARCGEKGDRHHQSERDQLMRKGPGLHGAASCRSPPLRRHQRRPCRAGGDGNGMLECRQGQSVRQAYSLTAVRYPIVAWDNEPSDPTVERSRIRKRLPWGGRGWTNGKPRRASLKRYL